MQIKDYFFKKKLTTSFEFFPPRSQKASDNLFETIKKLVPLKPTYVSVTYGAGGTTRELTNDLVIKLHKETKLTIVPHLTCIGSTFKDIEKIIHNYQANGILNIMVLRGDIPKNEPLDLSKKDFKHAVDLVRFIKKINAQMGIGVAGFPEGHPECTNRLLEIDYLKEKVDAGVDYICTQLFFDNKDYYDYIDRCQLAGINIPIVPGVMPITSLSNLKRMADLAQGVRFPAKLLKSIIRTSNDTQVFDVGIHWASEQTSDLLNNNVPGVHFYTLNKYESIIQICKSLGISTLDELTKEKLLSDKF